MSYRDEFCIEDLKGKILTKINWDGDSVSFHWKDGSARFDVFGDCCSVTWIDSFDGVEDLVGKEILHVQDLTLPEMNRTYNDNGDPVPVGCGCKNKDHCNPADEYNHDSLALYGYRFDTLTSSATLDFRNDSNGYYGGSLDYAGEMK